MIKIRSLILASTLFAGCAVPLFSHAQSITLVSDTDVTDGAEAVAFSPDGGTVAATVNGTTPAIGVQLFTLSPDATLTTREFVDASGQFGGAIRSVSSVALDPLGRGFGVMTVIPAANRTTNGIILFFDYRAGTATVLETLTVGFHPDHVIFSRDGSKVFVANEGEFTTGGDTDAPGSVSIIDLSGITSAADVAAALDQEADVTTIDFSAGNLAPGVDLDDLRYNDDAFTAGNAYRQVEPESLTEGDDKLYVTLQENNAIAELSLTGENANRFTAITPLGMITQTIDASDQDGPGGSAAAIIDDTVKGLPMPNGIACFEAGGTRYLVTANQGAFRSDNADRTRVRDFTGTDTGVTMNRTNAVLGRLAVVTDASDPDDDDLINEAIMAGTRSVSIWDASTGALVADTGSLEGLLLDLSPTLHNIEGASGEGAASFDLRSDDSGPEPAAMTSASINGYRYVFVGMKQQGAILMFNLEDPETPAFVTSVNNAPEGLVTPESITFIPASDSPLARATLLVGYGPGGKIGVYSVAAEPAIPPTLTVRKAFKAGAKTKQVVISGTASANTARVLVGRKTALGTTSWSTRVPFPLNKSKLRIVVVAVSEHDARTTTIVNIKRSGKSR